MMINKVINFDCTEDFDRKAGQFGRQRPDFLNMSKYLVENIKTLLSVMPSDGQSIESLVTKDADY